MGPMPVQDIFTFYSLFLIPKVGPFRGRGRCYTFYTANEQTLVCRLTDRPYMTIGVYRGRKATKQQHYKPSLVFSFFCVCVFLAFKGSNFFRIY